MLAIRSLLIVAAAALYACCSRGGTPTLLVERNLSGQALGTSWSVKAVVPSDGGASAAELSDAVAGVLDRVDRAFSTWRSDAEIARFNAREGTGPFVVSAEVSDLVARALQLARATGGAFDPTVGPLVALWGFGAGAARGEPDEAAIAAALGRVGHDKLAVTSDGLVSEVAGVELDLSAIAKGWAVDAVVAELAARRVRSAMVELGGEVRVFGGKADGAPWRLGVEVPTDDAGARELHEFVLLTAGALATSGDYRQARVGGGERVSHIIDPRIGRPILARVAAASVIAPTCAEADGVATALMVMAPEEGLAFIEARPWLEALLVLREGDVLTERRATSGWARYR